MKYCHVLTCLLVVHVTNAFIPASSSSGHHYDTSSSSTSLNMAAVDDHEQGRQPVGRRGALGAVFKGAAAIVALPFLTLSDEAHALDMDAFMNSEVRTHVVI